MATIYDDVTQSIITELEQGAAPWVKPWTCNASFTALPQNATTAREYSGTNILLLWLASTARGFVNPSFLTYKQAEAAGGHVRKGEKGTRIVFAGASIREALTAEGETTERRIPFLKGYTVFNVEQCDDLPDDMAATPAQRPVIETDADFSRFVASTGAKIIHKGNAAFYSVTGDFVQIPHPDDFDSAASYQATVTHELGHWTGAPHRLAREYGKRFGDKAYAFEELVAELTAAFMCARMGIKGELRHAGYIGQWLDILKADSRAVFTAASHASKAADFLTASTIEAADAA
tara:strand:+ start:644 stop:1516 length:873 start_codon:yes stop_codon:yes gene_type:complete